MSEHEIIVKEKFKSRERIAGQGASVTLIYDLYGSNDDGELLDALQAESPGTYGDDNMPRASSRVKQVGNLWWEGRVRYSHASTGTFGGQLQPGQSSFAFEIAVQQVRIVKGIAVVAAYGAGASVSDNGGLIGASSQGVQGTEMMVPTYEFSETHAFTDAQISNSYKNTLADLVGTVNNGTFRGQPAGTLLAIGVSGNQRGDGNWELAFRWAKRKNQTGKSFGDITGVNALGWEHIDVRTEPAEIDGFGRIGRKPIAVYVHQIYETSNYSGFGIGTS
ncbi:hypothetical protein ACERK3_09375 [Phycisphaerales bacterium AB-hyl4]|uniref:Uncharacterized protein n=1 Tax=Natronomicrosphaera hydrolytica TaxID=3242702 RepID=A0ABV4U4H4_9BACT